MSCCAIQPAAPGRGLRCDSSHPGTDRYEAVVTADTTGAWTFQIEAWGDPLESWRHDARIKIPEGQDVELMLEEGARLHEQAAANLSGGTATAAATEIRATPSRLAQRRRDVALTRRSGRATVGGAGPRRPRPSGPPPIAHAC